MRSWPATLRIIRMSTFTLIALFVLAGVNSEAGEDQSPECANFRAIKNYFARQPNSPASLEALQKLYDQYKTHYKDAKAVGAIKAADFIIKRIAIRISRWADKSKETTFIGNPKEAGRFILNNPELMQSALRRAFILYILSYDVLRPRSAHGPTPTEFFVENPLRLFKTRVSEDVICRIIKQNEELTYRLLQLRIYADADREFRDSNGDLTKGLALLKAFQNLQERSQAKILADRLESIDRYLKTMNIGLRNKPDTLGVATIDSWKSPTVRLAEKPKLKFDYEPQEIQRSLEVLKAAR
jgi:hypothetical protein